MTHERLSLVFRIVTAAIQFGNFDGTIAELRKRPWMPGHDITDDEIAEVMGLTLRELEVRLKGD